jgi:peptidoglycan/xylan/chitin deacetylase (PgdA/CDA1 family)
MTKNVQDARVLVEPPTTGARSRVLDHHRVPYPVSASDGVVRLAAPGSGRELGWPRLEPGDLPLSRFSVDGVTLYGPLLDDRAHVALLGDGSWSRRSPVKAADGTTVSWLYEADDGSLRLPFDPDACALTLLAELYLGEEGASGVRSLLRRGYYQVKPLLPRSLQLFLRRRYRSVQDRAAFPAWPAEPALAELYELVLRLANVVIERLPLIEPWPDGFSWAVVLTHDVERQRGYDAVNELAEIEQRLGFRSAWFFVPERDYRVDDDVLAGLRARGFEIGLHGLRHDGRDLEPKVFERRLEAMRRYAEKWGVYGFRAPATHRRWELMPKLGVDYDTSYSDVARYEPQPGGACSLWPFFIENLVELPITLPMDHTVFELLGEEDESLWIEKAAWLRERGGMALVLTHPDYLHEPKRFRAYERFLEWVAADTTCWRALPADVSTRWRQRAETSPVHDGGSWRAEGPAEGRAKVAFYGDG